MKDKYRFDDAYGKVSVFLEEKNAYLFECTYHVAGIKAKMREKTKIAKMAEYDERNMRFKN